MIKWFLRIVHISDTSAQSLKNYIDKFFFTKNELSISRVRCHGHGGASNIHVEFNGLKVLILKDNEHAYFINYFAHRLQLIVIANVSQNGYL